jgi:DNA-cytosine methyltransferase
MATPKPVSQIVNGMADCATYGCAGKAESPYSEHSCPTALAGPNCSLPDDSGSARARSRMPTPGLRIAGLFAGIGGLEIGMAASGHYTQLLVENDPAAMHVVRRRFPDVRLEADVRDLQALPSGTDVVVAGFPCQDLSSVGRKVGIDGAQSSLVGEVLRLLKQSVVPWVVLENVPFLMSLGQGSALQLITTSLTELGYRWAYRVVDSNAFGLPQRRNRWYLVATQKGDPRAVLLADDCDRPHPTAAYPDVACGFYWTEGMRSSAGPWTRCRQSSADHRWGFRRHRPFGWRLGLM